MLALLTPIPLISLGYVVSELTGRMDYMPILQWSALNYFYLNAFFLSGIDLSSVIMSHSLSVDRVKTTAQNWVKILVSTIPSQIALLSLIFGPSAWTLPILSMTLIGIIIPKGRLPTSGHPLQRRYAPLAIESQDGALPPHDLLRTVTLLVL